MLILSVNYSSTFFYHSPPGIASPPRTSTPSISKAMENGPASVFLTRREEEINRLLAVALDDDDALAAILNRFTSDGLRIMICMCKVMGQHECYEYGYTVSPSIITAVSYGLQVKQ
jgi:hypothetical protein